MRQDVALMLLATVLGCGGSPESAAPAAGHSKSADASAGEVVATFAGRQLTRGEVLEELERLPAPSRAYLHAPERKQQFVDNMIMNELLFDEGKQAGHDRDPEIERQVNDLRKRLVIQRVMRTYQTPPEIGDEQAKKYYTDNPSLYSTTQIRASHILVKDEEAAKQIAAELKKDPQRFADLAKEKSTDTTTAQKGGDLGLFGAGRMVPDFERVAFALAPGAVSDAVKTQYGWHVITVTERKEGEAKPFEQVKEQIKATLRNRGMQDQVQGHFAELRRSSGLKIDDAALARITPPAPVPPASPHGTAAPAGH
jgi:peptidyl-prolyl cis-trans isomerase C